jgi:hypothetical protein
MNPFSKKPLVKTLSQMGNLKPKLILIVKYQSGKKKVIEI